MDPIICLLGDGCPIVEIPVTEVGARPTAIALGPGRQLWFTDARGAVGRIDPTDNAIIEFPLPGTQPGGLVEGPDGNLWVTNIAADRGSILRVGFDGEVTEFFLDVGGGIVGHPTGGIVLGPDDFLWFPARVSTVTGLGRMTSEGAFAFFPLVPTESTIETDGLSRLFFGFVHAVASFTP
jgi:streptogramin lyase